MRVLILNQFFYPDVAATAQLATDLAVDLVARGHEVTAVASGSAYADGAASLKRLDTYCGVRIVRVPSFGFGRKHKLLRAVDYGSFLAGALVPVLSDTRPDVLIALSTPPFVAALGLVARRLRGVRLLFWVMDVYPDIAVRLGVLREHGVGARVLAALGRHMLARADGVIALDDAMARRLIEGGAPPDRVHVIDNWCDGDAIRPSALATNALRERLGLGARFTVSYSGNMGLAHDFDTVLEAMRLLRDDGVHWLFIGDGPCRPQLEERARRLGLFDVTFLSYRERDELPVSLTAAHASLITMRCDVAGLVVPSKLYGLLAAGVPLLYVGPPEGRPADVIRESGVGVTVANGDAAGLVAAIRRMQSKADEREQMGHRGRALFDARFARGLALDRHNALVVGQGQARFTHPN